MSYKCTICRRDGASVIYAEKFFCTNCINLFNTCATCSNNKKCAFNEDPVPMPKIVTQRKRQQTEMGYIEQIVQTPNPQRIKALCIEGECVCCDLDEKTPHCMRQFGVCAKYNEIEF